jgi:hypothetical protein
MSGLASTAPVKACRASTQTPPLKRKQSTAKPPPSAPASPPVPPRRPIAAGVHDLVTYERLALRTWHRLRTLGRPLTYKEKETHRWCLDVWDSDHLGRSWWRDDLALLVQRADLETVERLGELITALREILEPDPVSPEPITPDPRGRMKNEGHNKRLPLYTLLRAILAPAA